ncbi:MAG: hypothetical protein WAM04_15880 [Candidatus Sulfotelmatobacter sp.]
MRRHYCLAVILLASAVFAQTASTSPARGMEPVVQDEGDAFSTTELARELPPDKDHPLARKLIAAQEGEISCAPAPLKILVAHYRAKPVSWLSMNDDRIVIAAKRADEFKVLKILDSETAIVDGNLNSDLDFEEEFININEMHFLRIRTRISGSGGIVEDDVYTISSDRNLSIIPFQDVSKSKILREGEELRNGGYRFAEGIYSFEAGIYRSRDGGCCPTLGTYDAEFRLEGKFTEDARSNAFEPGFQFVVAKEWRGKER